MTGANSGIGLETARALAAKGARVIMACRDPKRAESAAGDIRSNLPKAQLELVALDLASLESVKAFAADFAAKNDSLDLLVNNAGVMTPPYSKTAEGFELQIGTNHLGHFALTALLLPLLHKTPASRVVVVASLAHKWGDVDLADLSWDNKPYKKTKAYGQSKLANLLFTYELQRRLEAAGSPTIAVAAHPGWTATNLQQFMGLARLFNPVFAQKPPQGAWPTLYAATAADVEGGQYFGPGGFQEIKGHPKRVESNARSHDQELARKLWQLSEDLVGLRFESLSSGAN